MDREQAYSTQTDSYAMLEEEDNFKPKSTLSKHALLGQYLAEFLGSFFLVLIVETATAENPFHSESVITIQYAIGFGLVILLYQFGYISGGHFNPCVTLGLHISGHNKLSLPQMSLYFLFQTLGGICGAFTSWGLTSTKSCATQYISVQPDYEEYQAFFAEFAFTFMLVTVMINMVEQQLDFFGIGVGFCLFASIGAIGHISGCCLNPIVYIGTMLSATLCTDNLKSIHYKYFWIYLVAEFWGGIIAGLLFKYVFSERGGNKGRHSTYHNVTSNRFQKYLTEFIGTFFLILYIKLCIGEHGLYYNPDSTIINPFYHLVTQQSIGFAVVMLLYTYGYIGGAHYNPVVTLVFYLNGHSSMTNIFDFIMYIIVQMFGGLCGALYAWIIGGNRVGKVFISFNENIYSQTQAFFAEIIFTFFFALVVANTACKQVGNQFAGLTIGWSVFVCIGCIGSISGAALNPIVWFSTYISAELNYIFTDNISKVTWQYSYIYTIGCMIGALMASLLHKYLYLPRVDEQDEIEFTVGDNDDWSEKIRKYLAEFIGTFFLVIIIKISHAEDGLSRGSITQMTIGLGLTTLLYLFGWISGGYYNPAVTLGITLTKIGAKEEENRANYIEVLIYILMQIIGGICGGFVSWAIANETACMNYIQIPNEIENYQAFGAEFVFTFFLVFVIINVTIGQNENQFFGIAIGFVLLSSIGCITKISNCCLNPAVYIGTIIPASMCKWIYNNKDVGPINYKDIWIYIISELLGGIIAGILYKYTLNTEQQKMGKYQKYMVEFIGTFLFVSVIKLSAGHNFEGDIIDINGFNEFGHLYEINSALSIGFCLVSIIYAFGYVSGGHFNPAITIGLVARGSLHGFKHFPHDIINVISYIFAQIIGAICGGYYAWSITNNILCENVFPSVNKSNGYSISHAFGAEFICTFLLVITVCHVVTKQFGNWFYGIVIGWTFFVSINTIGQISASCLNPAVYIGTIVSAMTCAKDKDKITFQYIWIYVIGTTVSAITAGILFKYIFDPNFGDTDMEKKRFSISMNQRKSKINIGNVSQQLLDDTYSHNNNALL
eukprot:437088_1